MACCQSGPCLGLKMTLKTRGHLPGPHVLGVAQATRWLVPLRALSRAFPCSGGGTGGDKSGCQLQKRKVCSSQEMNTDHYNHSGCSFWGDG